VRVFLTRLKRVIQRLIVLVAVSAMELVATSALASHFRFANLSWKRAPGTNALAVEITLTEAWQRSSKDVISYAFGDGTGFFDSSAAVLSARLADQAGEEYEVWRHTTTHTYPSNGVFTVVGTSCCRISSLVNAGDASERLSMVIDLRNNNSGSPVTAAPVILQMQAGTNNAIALPIVDPDGDPYQVRMATLAESSIPRSPQVGTNTLTVTSAGVLNWNTAGGFAQQKFAVQLIIEENRAGNPTGTNGLVPLDFIIELLGTLTNRAPTVVGTNGTITLSPNQRFTTTLVGTDPEGGPLVVSHQGLPPPLPTAAPTPRRLRSRSLGPPRRLMWAAPTPS